MSSTVLVDGGRTTSRIGWDIRRGGVSGVLTIAPPVRIHHTKQVIRLKI